MGEEGTGAEQPRDPVRERRDLHNASVDKTAAAAQLCGQVHLRSGKVCVLEVHHRGGCHFVTRDEMRSRFGS